jgi:hypothetical protein
MIEGGLGTTNIWLGIIAVVSVLEALVLIAVGIFAYRLYTQAMTQLRELEQRQIAPVVDRVNAILTDVRGLTARVSDRAERVDHVMQDTIDRVDETAERVKYSVQHRMNNVIGIARGVRAILTELLSGGQSRRPSAPARGPA